MAPTSSWRSSASARPRSSTAFFRARRSLFRSSGGGLLLLFLLRRRLREEPVELFADRRLDRAPHRLEQESQRDAEVEVLLAHGERARDPRPLESHHVAPPLAL